MRLKIINLRKQIVVLFLFLAFVAPSYSQNLKGEISASSSIEAPPPPLNPDLISFAEIEPDDSDQVETNQKIGETVSKDTPKKQVSNDSEKKVENENIIKTFEPEPDDEQKDEPSLNISGTKTFEMKKAEIKGDIGHFSTENFDSMPGFHLDQSLHLEVDGNIDRSTKVTAVLDDKEDQERRFTIRGEGRLWNATLGDFPISIKDTEFTLYNKEVRGILLGANFHPGWNSLFLFSQSKGMARREQFRGAGQQQEFRLSANPVVQDSERVSIDGRSLVRGTDYIIDYEDGILKFLPHLLPIELTSWVIIEYEVSDSKLAFRRNLLGTRQTFQKSPDRRVGVTWLREADDLTPKSEVAASGTARPQEHVILGFDSIWRISKNYVLSGEQSFSTFDPNKNSEFAWQDKKIAGLATKLLFSAKTLRLNGELGQRRVSKNFKLIGRQDGATTLGERGLTNDILKETGKLSYQVKPNLSAFGSMENSKTNLSGDPTISAITFFDRTGGMTWKYKPKSQLEGRWNRQTDSEMKGAPISDRAKNVGAIVWDHEFAKYFSQVKVERTTYDDDVNVSSNSQVLQLLTSLGSGVNKKISWSVSAQKLIVDDDLNKDEIRSDTQNYTLDLNYSPRRVFNARGIFQWRQEEDKWANTRQNGKIADSRINYQPSRNLKTQAKYKVENTTKVLRDPSLDPSKYNLPPSLPLTPRNSEEIVGRFENPVQKSTANFTISYRFGEKTETNLDWKRRDLKDQSTNKIVSYNDRKNYEIKYTPTRTLKLSTEFEDGVSKNLLPLTELRETIKRIEARNEFFEGYIFTTRYEDHDENDVYLNDNDKRTKSKIFEFNRVFSKIATLELGVQQNNIAFKQPSKELERRAAFILTPSARNQRYRLFFSHKQIESETSGSHLEGGLNFSQFIGTDSMIDGEIKKVRSTASVTGSGYDGFVANAKMVITF